MKYTSYEIEEMLFNKQIRTYNRIMDLINKDFDTMGEDRLSILLRNCIDMYGDIQSYNNNLKTQEMYQVNYRKKEKENLTSKTYSY
jgi:hypothetical protein